MQSSWKYLHACLHAQAEADWLHQLKRRDERIVAKVRCQLLLARSLPDKVGCTLIQSDISFGGLSLGGAPICLGVCTIHGPKRARVATPVHPTLASP